MKVVATLLTRDEPDVVAVTIEHLRQQGIDHMIVTDNGSVGPARRVLESYAATGFVTVIDEPNDDYAQAAWVTRMARMAATDHAATWVINVDTDEFWVAKDRSKTLRGVIADLPPEATMVRAWRRNYVSVRGAKGPWHRRLVWRDELTLSERGTPLAPKVFHRGDPAIDVSQGNHTATGSIPAVVLDSEPIEVLHVPMRSWEQFRSKIAMGGRAYENSDLPAEAGWHWRADYVRLQDGTLERAYRRRAPSLAGIVVGRLKGEIHRDTWLRTHVERLRADALLPGELDAALAIASA